MSRVGDGGRDRCINLVLTGDAERVKEGGVRRGGLRRLLFGFGHLSVALGKLQPECLRHVRVESNSLCNNNKKKGKIMKQMVPTL